MSIIFLCVRFFFLFLFFNKLLRFLREIEIDNPSEIINFIFTVCKNGVFINSGQKKPH